MGQIRQPVLLTRDAFREGVFARDGHQCVLCGSPAQDAHHIIERRLFDDGGYYLDNGASVCGPCHIRCEQTLVSVEQVREAAGITHIVVPEHMYPDYRYDKWGNGILANGLRTRGELFEDESVQKILRQGQVLDLFTDYVSYPRTLHLPFSPGINDDDRALNDTEHFEGKEVVVTEKLDGENTSLYTNYLHARSVDGRSHPSQDWVKNFHRHFAHDIPLGWRVCGENLYAKHSIAYNALKSYFYGFSIWNERNECLSWDETLEWFELLGIEPVPVLYRGVFDRKRIEALYDTRRDYEHCEGYVIRLTESFHYSQFQRSIAKFVRPEHVQTKTHWRHGQPMTLNTLTEG